MLIVGSVLALFLVSSATAMASPQLTFPTTPVNLSNSKGSATDPLMTQSSTGTVYVTWTEKSHLNGFDTWIAGSNNGGVSFTSPAPKDISNDKDSNHLPDVTTNGAHVYIAYADSTANVVYFAYSNDSGSTFSAPIPVSTEFDSQNVVNSSVSPLVATSGQYVYVVWAGQNVTTGGKTQSDQVFFIQSDDYGYAKSWGPIQQLGEDLGTYGSFAHEPAVAVNGADVYLVFDGGGIFYQVSHNYGAPGSWTETTLHCDYCSGPTLGRSREPLITEDGGNVYITWTSSSNATVKHQAAPYNVYVAVSTDGGNTFGINKPITSVNGKAEEPQVAASSGHIYVMYRYKNNVYMIVSPDNGVTFKSTQITTDNTAGWGTEAAVGSNVYMIWPDQSGNGGNWDVFVSASNDYGQTFSTPYNLSNDPGQSGPIPPALAPAVIASNDGTHGFFAWQDTSAPYSSSGNSQILLDPSNTY